MVGRQKKSILCPNCSKLISTDEPVCPYCGTSRPGSWWKSNVWTKRFLSQEQIISSVIYVNVGMYVISILLNPSHLAFSGNPLTFLSPSDRTLLLLGATGTFPIDRLHRWWTLISANYLHGGILHILFNMLALRQIGLLVLQEYGVHRTIALYTFGGVAGFLVSYLAGVTFTIGASAAVCSLIGAALYHGRSRGGSYGQAVYRQVLGWVIGLFLFGLLVPGINNWAHGGGIGAGIILGLILGYEERRKENYFHKILAFGCVLVTVFVLGWSVVTSIYYRLLG
jgi:rhomboid protease GluP